MLIDAIRLKGFLSHYGRTGSDGRIEPIEVDFQQSPLWLVHGPNGAGKSALVFDAVGLALYGEHRGGRSGTDFLIHQDVDEALIEVDLTLRGERYRVQRTLRKRGGKKKSSTVYRWVNGDWRLEPGTENDVEAWAETTLHMKWKTFQATVLLRQGEADVFLKAKATERRERLMELIDLTFYRELGLAADRRLKDWQKECDNCQKWIDEMDGISDEEFEQQEGLLAETRQRLEKFRELHEEKQEELRTARHAQQLKDDLNREHIKKQTFDALLAQAEQIVQDVNRFNNLNAAVPQLASIYQARSRLADADAEEQSWRDRLAEIEGELLALQDKLEQARRDYADALEADQLDRIEELEARIAEVQIQLEPSQPILEAASDIEAEHSRQELLAHVVPLLKALESKMAELNQRKAHLTATEMKQAEAQRFLTEDAEAGVTHAQGAVDGATAQQNEMQEKVNACQERMRTLRDKLEHRHALTGEEVCPTCGSALDSENVRARLAAEREKWEKDLAYLKQEAATLEEELNTSKQNLGEAKHALFKAEQVQRKADNALTAAKVNAEHAAQDVVRAQNVYEQAYTEAGEWAEEVSDLESLEAELEGLQESQRWAVLQEAQEVKREAMFVINECRRGLAELPKWTVAEREIIRANLERIESNVREWKGLFEITETLVARTGAAFQTIQTRLAEKNAEKRVVGGNLEAWSQRAEKAKQEIIQLVDSLPTAWKSDPASRDENAFNLLRDELASLADADAPERANDLCTAQREADTVKGAINTLESQLEQIPQELRRPIVEVEREEQQLQKQLEKQEKRHEEASRTLERMLERRQKRAEFENKRDHAAQECRYYERLTKAFGKQGLQARVIQAAQDLIRHNANETLRRLSRGTLEIELLEGDGSELEILVRDLSQPGAPRRAFEYLSGGEKFRVAVSLAVGIGQSIPGGRSTDTLLIDEGFGSLDDDNRVLMVDELRRLSEEVLQGGRVVVISHQEDVCEGFVHRFLVTKDEQGRAQVEKILA